MIFQSFCPIGKSIKKVTIYPSKYGLSCMKLEEKYGPSFLKHFKSDTPHDTHDDSDNESQNENENESDSDNDIELQVEVEDESDESDDTLTDTQTNTKTDTLTDTHKPIKKYTKMKGDFQRNKLKSIGIIHENILQTHKHTDKSNQSTTVTDTQTAALKLREYELYKLKYYYAIIECSDNKVAVSLFDCLDGIELEHSSMTFDLKYVANDISFEEWENVRKEVCYDYEMNEMNQTYKPPDFIINALQVSYIINC